jgi:hypothetical protein
MKLNHCILSFFTSCFAMAILVAPQTLHASPVPTLTVNGSAVLLSHTLAGGVDTYVYTDTSTNVLDTRTTTFEATFADIGGIDVLNVTDLCAQVTLFGSGVPCEALAFSFTGIGGDEGSIVSALGTAHVFLAGDVANIDFDASVGGGTGIVDFSPAPTPEPESLALLATGLVGVAGVVRRKASL